MYIGDIERLGTPSEESEFLARDHRVNQGLHIVLVVHQKQFVHGRLLFQLVTE